MLSVQVNTIGSERKDGEGEGEAGEEVIRSYTLRQVTCIVYSSRQYINQFLTVKSRPSSVSGYPSGPGMTELGRILGPSPAPEQRSFLACEAVPPPTLKIDH